MPFSIPAPLRALMLGILVTALSPFAAGAQGHPSKATRIVVPFAPGGAVDILARALAERIQASWGQTVLVENRPGGSSIIGSNYVAKAAPDGYTLLLTANPFTVNPGLFDSLPYDTQKDFAAVSLVAYVQHTLSVRPSLPVKTVPELIAYAKANSGKLNYGSSGNGGPQHIAGELLKNLAGIDMTHVPFKGSAPALIAVLAGQVDVNFPSFAEARQHIERGDLRPLAITSPKRSEAFPQLPTVAEAAGLPDYQVTTWFGLLTPAKTPAGVIARLQEEVAKAVRTPEMIERIGQNGFDLAGTTSGEFQSFIDSEITRYRALIKAANIKPG